MTPAPLVRTGRPGDAATVAEIHADRISEGFLATLGPRFLTRLYRRIAASPAAVLSVADADGTVVGFAAGTVRTATLYKEFVRRDGLAAGAAAAPAIARAPRHVWETLRYGLSGDHDDLPDAEILSIAVAAGHEGAGIGGHVLDAALRGLQDLGVTSAHVVTTIDNGPAIAMYERAGFVRRRHTEVHRGVAQQVLVWG